MGISFRLLCMVKALYLPERDHFPLLCCLNNTHEVSQVSTIKNLTKLTTEDKVVVKQRGSTFVNGEC